jgi:hypothetical protein
MSASRVRRAKGGAIRAELIYIKAHAVNPRLDF